MNREIHPAIPKGREISRGECEGIISRTRDHAFESPYEGRHEFTPKRARFGRSEWGWERAMRDLKTSIKENNDIYTTAKDWTAWIVLPP